MPTLRSISSVLEGCAFEVQGNYVMIGSETDNTVRLEHSSVSAHHAILTVGDGEFKLWDLHSTNGIKVNGKPIVVTYLQDGDQILLGEVELRFEVGKDGKRETRTAAAATRHSGKPVSEIAPGAGLATLSQPQRPSRANEPFQAEHTPASRPTIPDEGPRIAPAPRHPVTPLPQPVVQPPDQTLRPAIRASPPGPSASADPANAVLSGSDQLEQPSRTKGMTTATVRRFIWAGIFFVGIAVFVLGFSRSGHVFNFIGLVMIVLGAAALLVNLRCGSLIAPPRKKEEPAPRR